MAPNPQCSALAAAKDRSGQLAFSVLHCHPGLNIHSLGLSYGAIASKIGTTEQHVIDLCTGSQRPTTAEFNSLASVLGIANAPATPAHATK
ncbi:hypothetical protein C8F01DRAFT_1251181 [Mycena amicta]|nr:hypothetical protein C8F01DRAFT_1251181 [Mycena amicta]